MTTPSVVAERAPFGERAPRLRKVFRRLGVAALCAIPPTDLVLSDTVSARVSNYVNDNVFPFQQDWNGISSHVMNRVAQNGALSAEIFGESFLLALLIRRNRTIRNSFAAFDSYVAYRQAHMSPVRKLLSRVVNAPVHGIGKIGDALETCGDKVASLGFKGSERTGKLIADIGKTNAIGTSGVVLDESMRNEEPVSVGRAAEVSAIITLSWLPTAEAVRHTYRALPRLGSVGQYAQDGLAMVGRSLEAATTVSPMDPTSTPIGTAAMSFLMASMMMTGYNIARSQEAGLLEPVIEA